MNPHASYKCAVRLLMAAAAMSSVLLISGCGSSSSTPAPNPTGFGTSSLNGTYVIAVSGTDADTTTSDVGPFALVGTIVANGSGGITGGTVDINDPVNGDVNTGQAVTSSSAYQIGTDGRGTATVVTSVGTFDFDFVLTSTSNGLISRFDDSATNVGTGSGTIDLQSSASQSSFTTLAFSLSGADTNGTLASVGALTLNPSGTIASGTQDFNENGSSSVSALAGLPITGGQVVLASSGTSGTAVLDSGFGSGSFAFDVWVIGPTHVKLIETDTSATSVLLSGDAFTQQTTFPAGQVVFTLGGQDASSNPFVSGGYATATSSGDLNSGLEDYNDNGTAVTARGFTATATTSGSAPGRYQITSNGYGNGSVGSLAFAAYPSSGGVLMLEDDSNGLALGAAYAQTATSFNASGGYGLNLSGTNANPNFSSGAEVDDIAQFDVTSAVAPAVNMTGTLDENDLAYQLVSEGLSGTYTPDTNSDGRGSIVATTTGTLIGGLTLEYYVVDGSNILFIEQDSGQIAMGTFQPQSSSASAAVAHRAVSMVRPVVRPHAVLRRK